MPSWLHTLICAALVLGSGAGATLILLGEFPHG